MKKEIPFAFLLSALLSANCTSAQLNQPKDAPTVQDSLRGSITPERAWWDVVRYDITVTPDYASRTISGSNTLTFRTTAANGGKKLQLDLQEPMVIDHILLDGKTRLSAADGSITRNGNAWFVQVPELGANSTHLLTVAFRGKPRAAINPPWDGGWIWKTDDQGRPWMSVACQGLGASVWYPCKDHQSDEPDKGARLTMVVPESLVAVANGKLKEKKTANGKASYTWEVINPINNYNIIPYIGHYTNFTKTFAGEKGNLNASYWVLDYNLEKAKKQFEQADQTLKAFEHWFGPYPFYEDDFKLVESPHLGMEHQSAVAYGNKYMNGYLGTDLSGTGWGKKWDFIIVHESGHEWFGNNITSKDIADMWVHEGFTNYSETLFTQYHYGKEAGDAYAQGIRKNISNERPIIGEYGVNREGSGDMYAKGASLIHTIRQVIADDEKFRSILRGLNKDFYHQTVTSRQVEDYISQKGGFDFSKVFDQYLRTTKIPVLELQVEGTELKYRWTNTVEGFNLPVRMTNGKWIRPTADWQKVNGTKEELAKVEADRNFYIRVKKG